MDAVVEKAADRADKLLGESSKDGASAEAIKASTQAEEAFEKVKGELKEKFPRIEQQKSLEVSAYGKLDAGVEKAADRADELLAKSGSGASAETIKAANQAEEAFEKVKGELKEKFPQFENQDDDAEDRKEEDSEEEEYTDDEEEDDADSQDDEQDNEQKASGEKAAKKVDGKKATDKKKEDSEEDIDEEKEEAQALKAQTAAG